MPMTRPIKYKAVGGPFAGHYIYLTLGTDDMTAVIRVGKQVGRYIASGVVVRWVPLLARVGV